MGTMLSIIIPSYKGADNLENNLPGFLSYLNSKNISFELIVVDDGSEDNGRTEKITRECGGTYLLNEKRSGKGAAVRKGMLHAKGTFKLFTDTDIPFQYDSVDSFLYYLNFKEFDMVIGDRTLPGSSYFKNIPLLRKWSSALFTFFVGRFVTTSLMDTQCGIKGFRAAVADDLFSVSTVDGFAFDVEILYIALKRNYDIKRLPVRLRSKSDQGLWLLSQAPGMIKDVLLLKINHLAGKYTKRHE